MVRFRSVPCSVTLSTRERERVVELSDICKRCVRCSVACDAGKTLSFFLSKKQEGYVRYIAEQVSDRRLWTWEWFLMRVCCNGKIHKSAGATAENIMDRIKSEFFYTTASSCWVILYPTEPPSFIWWAVKNTAVRGLIYRSRGWQTIVSLDVSDMMRWWNVQHKYV